jgi:hypothetical protein
MSYYRIQTSDGYEEFKEEVHPHDLDSRRFVSISRRRRERLLILREDLRVVCSAVDVATESVPCYLSSI